MGHVGNGAPSRHKQDWYRVVAARPCEVAIQLDIEAAREDLDLALFKGDDETPIATSAGSSKRERLTVAVRPGIYFVEVHANKDTDGSRYSLTVSVRQ